MEDKTSKRCWRCKRELALEEFGVSRSRKGGKNNTCKVCVKEISKIRYAKNRLEILKRKKETRITVPKMTILERFESKLLKTASCWEWKGQLGKLGYGVFSLNGKNFLAHRASYTIFKGEIPKGDLVCHSCDKPNCVNPDHLWLGTQKDNMRDCIQKGRKASFSGKLNPNFKSGKYVRKNNVVRIEKLV